MTDLIPRPTWATVTERDDDHVEYSHTVARLEGVDVRLSVHAELDDGELLVEHVNVVVDFERRESTFTD
jgi:hypothetical protein